MVTIQQRILSRVHTATDTQPGLAKNTWDRLASFGERLDSLMILELRSASGPLPPGIVLPTYQLCRAVQGGPLTTLAASHLLQALSAAGKRVIIATGAGIAPSLPFGETDGPPGAAVMARALARGLGAQITLITEANHFDALFACAAEVQNDSGAGSITVELFEDKECGETEATALLDRLSPSALVFIERDGPNETGFFHGVRGNRRSRGAVAPIHLLALEARNRGIFTLGIGDGGNEIGFGKIREKLLPILPNLGRSNVDAAGLVSIIETDVLVGAAVSNWGAYAVSAALAIALGNPHLAHVPGMEKKLIASCVAAGARDGATGSLRETVDGVDPDSNLAVVHLIQSVVQSSIEAATGPNA